MKKLMPLLGRLFPVGLIAATLVLVCAHPAMANAFQGSGSGFASFGGYLSDVGSFLTSPFSKFIGALAIIGGVFTFIRGGEINQSMHIFGGVAIAVGLLVIGLAMINSFGTGLAI